MKKLGYLMIMIFISLSVMAKETKITIIGNNITIKEAFEQVEQQSKFSVAYNQTEFDAEKKITVTITNLSIEKTFTEILRGTGFTYKIRGSHIIIVTQSKKKHIKKLTQTIRGVVRDAASEQPLSFATAVLLNTDPMQGQTTDSLGRFRFDEVPIGRYDIEVSMIGYEPTILKEILVMSAKESYNEVRLRGSLLVLDEVIIRPNVNKQEPLNSMTLVGARMISVEESSRFAGGFDDPARLVSSFAGVSGGGSSTALSIRGNSPDFLQWRLEGIEIPSPSHFKDMMGIGGGVYTALSSQVMGNSDFFNSAFPAEYNNALSGIFDMSMRNGNTQNHEHTFQVGVLGTDIASEGPISKKNGSSYIFNYRYFNTEPIKELTGGLSMKFQDLSFKLYFPTRKAGIFSIWGFGLIDDYNLSAKSVGYGATTPEDMQNQKLDFNRFATGFNHKIFIGKNAYIKSSLAASYNEDLRYQEMRENREPFPMKSVMDMKNNDLNISFNSYINTKFSSRHTNRTGVSVTGLFYDLDFRLNEQYDEITSNIEPMSQIAKGSASNTAISVFSNSLIKITDRLSTNIGVTSQLFTLNNSWTIEPRISLKYQLSKRSTLALAYGLHSRREKLDYYYVQKLGTEDKFVNTDLKFAKAHHIVLSYGFRITDDIHFRAEPYYQYLYDMPVEPNTSFSTINQFLYYMDRVLVNDGEGQNYGIDITLEQYLSRGFYWMTTASIFNSTYKGGDNVWRDTKYNRKFITNGLIGKEWMCGKAKQNVFSVNIALLFQGGQYSTPINEIESKKQKKVVLDDENAFSEQYANTLTVNFSISYKVNRRKVSHEFALKVLNATGVSDQNGYKYNIKTDEVEIVETPVTIPNISYKIHF